MSASIHGRASELFLELRGLAREELARRIAAISDAALREEVRSLLEFDEAVDAPEELGAAVGAGVGGLPSRIGPYAVLQRLGHGGSGVVLLAEQREPVRRRVAIKIVPFAAISPELAARFEFERRALERTDHPNIARILDAGRTSDGLPYLVMEYVEGEPITAYCRSRGLDLSARIGLMLEVCGAVQHAHQRGVIHRDLKPANILVSEAAGGAGGVATAQVLDFGISKPTPGTAVTMAPPTSASPMGTPGYMAPEQTGGQSVDTRADIYAIAAILYELVCGRAPIETHEDALETLRRLREDVPFPASRVRALRADPPALGPLGRGMLTDLDCILSRALEKSPARRYTTVEALAEDLRRLLRREPIEARGPSVMYRAARFAQRNRGLVAGLVAAALALVVGIGGLVGGLVEAKRQQAEAVNQSQALAEINRFLNDDLLAAASPQQDGGKITAIELLDRASSKIEGRFADRPLIAAAVHHTLGTAYLELAAFDKASEHLSRAVQIRGKLAGPEAPDTIRSEAALASLLVRQEKYKEAAPELSDLLTRARRAMAGSPTVYSILNDLGIAEVGLDRGKDAVTHLSEALDGRRRLLGESDPTVLSTMSNLAQAYDRVGDSKASLDMDLAALKLAEAANPPNRFALMGLYNDVGATYQDMNQDKEAAPYLRKAVALATDYLGPDNPDTLTIEANLASLEAELGDPARGMALYDAVVKARTRVLGPDAEGTLTGRYGYWNCVWIAKRFDEAAAGFRPLLEDMTRVLGPRHWLTIQTKAHLARALADGGHDAEALPIAKEAAAEFEALYGKDNARTTNAAIEVAKIEKRLGK